MYRIPVPKKQLLEEDELVWHDGVAPEMCIDFDAPHIGMGATVLMFVAMWAGLFAAYKMFDTKDWSSMRAQAPRELPESTRRASGMW